MSVSIPFTADDPPSTTFDDWAVLELFGHQKIAGRVTERVIGGAAFLQVDVPKQDGTTDYTRFYNPRAVYGISPVSRQIAIGFAERYKPEPVSRYDLTHLAQKQLTIPVDGDYEVGLEDCHGC